MTELVSSVRVEPVGAHESVVVYLRGQCVGNLVVGQGDGAPLRSLLIAETTDAPSHGAQSQPAPAPDYTGEGEAETDERRDDGPCSCDEALALRARIAELEADKAEAVTAYRQVCKELNDTESEVAVAHERIVELKTHNEQCGDRFRAAEARLAEATALAEWLDRKGGLGLDVHERVTAFLAAQPVPAKEKP